MELWDLYTADRKPTGKTHIRGDKIPKECFHLVVHVWIKNSKGQYLISQRSGNRPTFPLMWDCVGGSVLVGEDSLSGAIREVKEEVGIDLIPENGKLCFSRVRHIVDGKPFNDILDVWLFDYDCPVSLENATTNAVAQVQWMYPREIRTLLDAGKFVDTLSYFFEKIETQ